MSNTLPTSTPNVVVSNPMVRRIANVAISAAGLILGTVIAVDAATEALDLTAWTTPAVAGYTFLAGAFGIFVTVPNIPHPVGKAQAGPSSSPAE